MAITDAKTKLIYELSDIYDAERQFLQGMQQALDQADSQELRAGIQEHMSQTEQQIGNLEQVFSLMGETPLQISCDSARGLVAEAQKGMEETQDNTLRDGMIAGGLCKVEHYEIASYRALIVGLEQMGLEDAAQLLRQNLQQEEETAGKLEDLIQGMARQLSGDVQGPMAHGTDTPPPTI